MAELIQTEESLPEERWQTKTKSLKEGIVHIYNTGEFADCQFTVGTRTFKGHRLILSARSEIFAKMLLEEKNKDSASIPNINIQDVSEDGFEILLRFIYTDELGEMGEDKWLVLLDVCRAAKTFSVDDLLTKCDVILGQREITAGNVCVILNETADIQPLKERCFEFIKKNVNSVVASSGFLQATHPTLCSILETGYLQHINPKCLLERVVCWAGNQLTEAKKNDYNMIRELLLHDNPIQDYPLMSELGVERLTDTELDDVMDAYVGLITNEEYGQLLRNAKKPEAKRPIPKWCRRN